MPFRNLECPVLDGTPEKPSDFELMTLGLPIATSSFMRRSRRFDYRSVGAPMRSRRSLGRIVMGACTVAVTAAIMILTLGSKPQGRASAHENAAAAQSPAAAAERSARHSEPSSDERRSPSAPERARSASASTQGCTSQVDACLTEVYYRRKAAFRGFDANTASCLSNELIRLRIVKRASASKDASAVAAMGNKLAELAASQPIRSQACRHVRSCDLSSALDTVNGAEALAQARECVVGAASTAGEKTAL